MATGNEEQKKGEGKGFAGLSSLVSDVDIAPPATARRKPASTTSTVPSAKPPVAQPAQPTPNQQPSQQPNQAPSQPSSGSSGGKWVLGIAVVIGVFWLIGQSNKTTTSPVPAYSPPAQSTAPSYTPPPQPQAPSRPVESKPPVGQDLVFSREQIRYCLAEDIRMGGAKSALNNYSDYDVDRFNAMVTDYNSRCGSFRYRSGALEGARREIEPYRSQLYSEGHQRFIRKEQSKQLWLSVSGIPELKIPINSIEEIPDKLMSRVYHWGYDREHSCWKAKDEEENHYCMQIVRTDKIMADELERIYILATGVPMTSGWDDFENYHARAGVVGAFVIENTGNMYKITASSLNILMGSFGRAPEEWQFVQFGPSNYWGWQSKTSDMHGGYEGSAYIFLAPYGKKIRLIGNITAYFSNIGAIMEEDPGKTHIETKLKIDSAMQNVKVYPLSIFVTGVKNGEIISESTWKISFNEKKWEYIEPNDWPLADADY
jgi:hypothetical protein